jgi:DNA-directed RNA polymerase sigma subunit (sigma70/sigma32)
MSQLPISLEKPIGEEEDSELGDFVQDEQAESPYDTAQVSLRREDIENALASLPERDRFVEMAKRCLQVGQRHHCARILGRELDRSAVFRFRADKIEIDPVQDQALRPMRLSESRVQTERGFGKIGDDFRRIGLGRSGSTWFLLINFAELTLGGAPSH